MKKRKEKGEVEGRGGVEGIEVEREEKRGDKGKERREDE